MLIVAFWTTNDDRVHIRISYHPNISLFWPYKSHDIFYRVKKTDKSVFQNHSERYWKAREEKAGHIFSWSDRDPFHISTILALYFIRKMHELFIDSILFQVSYNFIYGFILWMFTRRKHLNMAARALKTQSNDLASIPNNFYLFSLLNVKNVTSSNVVWDGFKVTPGHANGVLNCDVCYAFLVECTWCIRILFTIPIT